MIAWGDMLAAGIPDATLMTVSMAAALEKLQQAPHAPWFLTLATLPVVRRSNDVGMLAIDRLKYIKGTAVSSSVFSFVTRFVSILENSRCDWANM